MKRIATLLATSMVTTTMVCITIGAAQIPSASEFDFATAKAWASAGAQVGWIAPDRNENWIYVETKPSSSVALAAFRFGVLRAAALIELPAPSVSFAVVLDGADTTDAALEGLARFKNLQGLNLSRTQATDLVLKAVRTMAGLRVLYLGNTNVTDAGMKELAGLEKLHTLRLSGTNVTDEGLKEVARLRRLEWLNLEATRASDSGLKELTGLTALRILHLGNTKVTDAGLKELVRIESLQVVRLRGATVTDAGVAALRKARPELTILP